MTEVGIKELKNNLSKYLRRVLAGERLRVTMHGKPVAEIAPIETERVDEDLLRLAAEGRLTLATKPKTRNPPPPEDFGRSLSDLIIAEREEERS